MFASSEREIREDDPGAADVGHHGARRHGPDYRGGDAVAGMSTIKYTYFRMFLALVSLASSALVISAGHRWQK
jgi:hypothetical protein